jgi:hypothetical protein
MQAAWRTNTTRVGDTTVAATSLLSPMAAELTMTRSGSIGAVSGPPEQLLTMVTTTLALSDGGVIFFDGGARQLQWFDSSLRFVKTLAKEGTGPGELPPMPAFTSSPGSIVEDRTVSKVGVDSRGRIVARYGGQFDGVFVYDSKGGFQDVWRLPRRSGNQHETAIGADDLVSIVYATEREGGCEGVAGESLCPRRVIRLRLDGTAVDSSLSPELPWTVPLLFYNDRHRPWGYGPAAEAVRKNALCAVSDSYVQQCRLLDYHIAGPLRNNTAPRRCGSIAHYVKQPSCCAAA